MTLLEPGSAGYTRSRGPRSSRHGLDLTPPSALRTRTASLSIAALFLALLLAPTVQGDIGLGDTDFDVQPKVTAYLSHAALAQGASGTLLALLTIPDEFHIQKNDFLEVIVPENAPITLGPLDAPTNAAWAGEAVLKGTSALKARFKVKENAPIGPATFTVAVGYQGCSEGPIYACYPPEEAEIALTLEVLEPSGAPQLSHQEIFAAHGISIASPGSAPTPAGGGLATSDGMNLEARVKDALARGSFVAFLLVFLGGVLASLTPCVFPMIPITISYVGGRARSRMHGFTLSLIFVLGLAIMYAVLGLAATATGGVFGATMQSPIAMVIVAFIFAAMGASMLGAFDLVVPSSLTTSMSAASSSAGKRKGGDIIGAVLMGVTTGLVAAPCVGPVLVALLTSLAEAGTSPIMGFWLLFTFAFGLGLIFLILGTFAGAISSLPGAGSWMDMVKHVFGVILIAMAIYYLSRILDPQVTRFLLGVYLVSVGVFTGAFTPLPESPTRGALLRKALGILIFLTGAVIFLLWLFALVGIPLTAPSDVPGGVAGVSGARSGALAGRHAGPPWVVNADEIALEQAQAEGKPLIQDFYADWCPACVELDEKTWSDPAVIEEAKRFLPLKMDFTSRGEFQDAATRRYKIRGMPTVVFYDSQGNEVTRFFGFKGPREVLEIMRSIH